MVYYLHLMSTLRVICQCFLHYRHTLILRRIVNQDYLNILQCLFCQ